MCKYLYCAMFIYMYTDMPTTSKLCWCACADMNDMCLCNDNDKCSAAANQPAMSIVYQVYNIVAYKQVILHINFIIIYLGYFHT